MLRVCKPHALLIPEEVGDMRFVLREAANGGVGGEESRTSPERRRRDLHSLEHENRGCLGKIARGKRLSILLASAKIGRLDIIARLVQSMFSPDRRFQARQVD